VSLIARNLAFVAGVALLFMSACAHQDAASNAAGASSSPSLTDQIAGEMGRMNSDQNAAQQDQDAYNRALQDPSLAFGDPTSVAVARAAADGDAAQVRQLVARGARLDVHGMNNITLLEWEVLHGSIPGVNALLDAGADPSQRGVGGKTALSAAAAYGGPDYVRAFLDHHADPNATDEDGNTPLIDAMINDDDAPIDLLLQGGADVNRTGALGYTPLIKATLGMNAFARALRLLQAGADPRAIITVGGTPKTFQTYLNLSPRDTMSAEAKQGLENIDDWLNAHNVPIERPTE
jgi:ankyrin repeat protein